VLETAFFRRKRIPKGAPPLDAPPFFHPAGNGAAVRPLSVEVGFLSLEDKIAPNFLEVEKDYLRVDDCFFRIIYFVDYPPVADVGWLAPLLGADADIHVSLHITPLSTEQVVKKLTQQIAYYRAQLGADWGEGKVEDAQLVLSANDAERLRLELQRGDEKLFQVGLYVAISAATKEQLDQLTHAVEALLGAAAAKSRWSYYQMEDGFDTTLPLCRDRLRIRRNLTTSALATMFPFDQSVLTMDRGVLLGVNLQSNTLIVLDPFSPELENANGVVIAKSGAGKSYFAKLLALRSLYQGTRIVIIDPEREYDRLCAAVGGEYIRFTPNTLETNHINPFDLPQGFWEASPEERKALYNDKVMAIRGLLKTLLGGEGEDNPIYDSIIEEALHATYVAAGLGPEVFAEEGVDRRDDFTPPLLQDFYRVAEKLAHLKGGEVQEYWKLTLCLKPYAIGTYSGVLNHPTDVKMDNRFLVFDLKEWERDDTLRSLYMQLVFGRVWEDVRAQPRKTLILMDEAWLILQHPDAAQFVRSVAKRARKSFCGLWVLVQDVEDLVASDQWRAILSNSSIQVLFKQSPAVVHHLSEVFRLSEQEKWFLLNCPVGTGLVFVGGDHAPVRVLASEEEHGLITTNPLELYGATTPPGPTFVARGAAKPRPAPSPALGGTGGTPTPQAPKGSSPSPEAAGILFGLLPSEGGGGT